MWNDFKGFHFKAIRHCRDVFRNGGRGAGLHTVIYMVYLIALVLVIILVIDCFRIVVWGLLKLLWSVLLFIGSLGR